MMTRIEELEKQIQELKKELEFEKNKSVIEYPFEHKGKYWLLYNDGCIAQGCWDDDIYEQECYELGNIFQTKEEAEKEQSRRILLTRFRQFRDKCNGDWKPDFKDWSQGKFSISFNHTVNKLETSNAGTVDKFRLFGYFKNVADAYTAIKLFGDEINRLYAEEYK